LGNERYTQEAFVCIHAKPTPVSETVNLREEHAGIKRRPVDRPATDADLK
jgi:hypothetical protein